MTTHGIHPLAEARTRLGPSDVFATDARTAVTALFIVSILYGNIWLGITIPVSILLLPLVFFAYVKVNTFRNIPAGALLLLGMAVPIALQWAVGRPPVGKPDAVVYLPLLYAIATMIGLQSASLPERMVWRSLTLGGVITALVMLVMMAFVPSGRYLIPGQDAWMTQLKYQQSRLETQRRHLATGGEGGAARSATGDAEGKLAPAELGLENSSFETGFYDVKRSVRNALGTSNYIAAYFVFLFTVSLFYGGWISRSLLALATLATFSRFGVLFLGFAVVLWMLSRRGVKSTTLTVGALVFGLVIVVGTSIVGGYFDSYLPTSVNIRTKYWKTGVDVVAQHPLIGAPRSHILEQFNLNITWNPHNSLLWVIAFSGVLGLFFYVSFLLVSLARIHRNIPGSPLWAGVFFGFVILVMWSFVEPIALTPAFDVLLAALYAVARNAQAAQRRVPASS
jgi:O-antigen ligase/polysaccharide polymerase Wzy-like membrane protein